MGKSLGILSKMGWLFKTDSKKKNKKNEMGMGARGAWAASKMRAAPKRQILLKVLIKTNVRPRTKTDGSRAEVWTNPLNKK